MAKTLSEFTDQDLKIRTLSKFTDWEFTDQDLKFH